MGMHEIKEFQKGHVALHGTIRERGVEYVGKRHMARLMSDAYCKGIVRGQVECCNLRANHAQGEIVSAERISTAHFATFPGHAILSAVDRLADPGAAQQAATRRNFVRTQPTAEGVRHAREIDWVRAYGHRPCDASCWWLSPYEFVMYWEVVPARVPQTRAEWNTEANSAWDVTLTPSGARRMEASVGDKLVRLRPGQHYRISVPETVDRRWFPNTPGNATLRNAWYLQRRARPLCPHFAHSAVPRRFGDNVEQNAKMATVFFRAWTLDHARGTTSVPYVGHLRSIGESWAAALRRWASHGLPCQETKHYLGNFLSVYRVRPAADAKENSDDDGADEALELTEDLHTSEHAQSAVSVTGFKLAEQAWYQARTIQETQWDATDFEQLDPKALLKATRNAGRQLKRSERSDPAVPAVDAATRDRRFSHRPTSGALGGTITAGRLQPRAKTILQGRGKACGGRVGDGAACRRNGGPTTLGFTWRPRDRKIVYLESDPKRFVRRHPRLAAGRPIPSRYLSGRHGGSPRRRHHTSCVRLELDRHQRRRRPQTPARVELSHAAMALAHHRRVQHGERRTVRTIGATLP